MLGEALKQLRLFHGVKQKDLAIALGLSASYVSEIEKGIKTNITIDIIEKYSDFFDVKMSDLIIFSEQLSDDENLRPANKRIANKILKVMSWISENKFADEKSS